MRLFVTLLIATLFVALVGCRSTAPTSQNSEAPKAVSTRQVTDDLGRTITVPIKVLRVVSLAPSATEMVFAVGAGDRLVGVTTFCNYPEQAKEIAKVGDTMTPNMESIIALKPDIVLVSTASQIETFTKTLEQNGIAVFVMNPESLHGVMTNLTQLSTMFGTEVETAKLVRDLEDRSNALSQFRLYRDETPAALEARVKPVSVFVQISKEPLFTAGKTSFLTEVISDSGGRSVTANIDGAYPKISKETALALNPQVIVLSESDDNKEPNEVFKNSPAVKNGRILKVNADLLSRPGPRLVDAMEQIAKFLNPEKFK